MADEDWSCPCDLCTSQDTDFERSRRSGPGPDLPGGIPPAGDSSTEGPSAVDTLSTAPLVRGRR